MSFLRISLVSRGIQRLPCHEAKKKGWLRLLPLRWLQSRGREPVGQLLCVEKSRKCLSLSSPPKGFPRIRTSPRIKTSPAISTSPRIRTYPQISTSPRIRTYPQISTSPRITSSLQSPNFSLSLFFLLAALSFTSGCATFGSMFKGASSGEDQDAAALLAESAEENQRDGAAASAEGEDGGSEGLSSKDGLAGGRTSADLISSDDQKDSGDRDSAGEQKESAEQIESANQGNSADQRASSEQGESAEPGDSAEPEDPTRETQTAQLVREEIFDTEAAVLAKLRARPELSPEEEKALQIEMDRGLSLANRELFADALQHYQQLSERWPQVSALHYNRAVLLEQSGRVAEAKMAYRLALGLSLSNEAALENLLRLLVREQESQKAVDLLAKLVEREPESLSLRDKWLEMLVLAGKWELAEAEAKKVLRENERHVGAMLPLARMWHEEGKFELVRQVLENAREIEPNNAEVLNRLGVVLLELDYRSRALEVFHQAAALDDALPEAHNNLGALLVEVNDCKGAIEALEAAQRKAPHDSRVRLNLGNAYRCDRRMEEAREQYQLALKLDPLLNDARFNLAILFLDGEFEEVERVDSLRTSLSHFEAFREGQGEDPRLERYVEEAQKALDREEARLARAAERERQAQERAEREAAKRREEEARALAEKLARMQEIEARKVAKKSVIEDDPPPTKPVRVYRIGKIGEGK